MSFAKRKRKRADGETSVPILSPAVRRCSICGRKLPAGNPAASCPVCLLRIALDPGSSGAKPRENLTQSAIGAPKANPRRFGHYQILTRPDGSLHELGHGAMGITFKAVDLNLHIPVALKVLNLQLFQVELARRRFFREARSAARVRHPNVASVYHLGSRGPPETHLAPRLQSTIYSVSDGLLYCAVGLEDWPAVIDTCNGHLQGDRESLWARIYLVLGLQTASRQAEAREISEEVLRRGLERLERPAQPDIPWDVPLYVAWACRFAGRRSEAYRYLDQYLAHRTLLHLPLGLENPILDVFENDPEFKTILTDLKQILEASRRSIREHEAASAQG